MITYPIHETFHSLKGEGAYTGQAMFFIRLAGCNLSCEFCDTDYSETEVLSIREILDRAERFPGHYIVITGGEPLIHDVIPLVDTLRSESYTVHLETNGTLDIPPVFDWVAVSPKGGELKEALFAADEIKFLCGLPDWAEYIKRVEPYVRYECQKLLMPIAKATNEPIRTEEDFIQANVDAAMAYCLTHPEFRLCMQLHKVLHIK